PYARWGVADDVDGRFDMITLHMFLVLERLKGGNADFRQRLVDVFFADMDRSLREMGAGDLSVAKKVRKMAEVFYGRIAAYDAGLAGGREALTKALARNFFPKGDSAGAAAKLADYALSARAHLALAKADRLLEREIDFPEPLA
ncbi:MAG: ubiquinol-cytochrome C chaperone family protein, partial [Aestuariivirga sp.]